MLKYTLINDQITRFVDVMVSRLYEMSLFLCDCRSPDLTHRPIAFSVGWNIENKYFI